MPRNTSRDSFLEDKGEILEVLENYKSKLQAEEKAIITKVSNRLQKISYDRTSSPYRLYNELAKPGSKYNFQNSYNKWQTSGIVIEGITDEADQLFKKQSAVKNLSSNIRECSSSGRLREKLDNNEFKELLADLKEHRSSNVLLKKLFNVLNRIGLGGLMVTGIGKANKLNKFFNKHAPSIDYIDEDEDKKKDNKLKK
jgi:hypothetical protein